MSTQAAATNTARQATLKLSSGPDGQVLTASVPGDISENELTTVGRNAFALIGRLTHCNCLSGRIKFVVEENFAEVIQVDLSRT